MNEFWTIAGAIGSICGALLTPLAIIIAFKAYRAPSKKDVKIIFGDTKLINSETDLNVIIYNAGIRKVIISNVELVLMDVFDDLSWKFFDYIKSFINDKVGTLNLNHLCKGDSFPLVLHPEDSFSITIPLKYELDFLLLNCVNNICDTTTVNKINSLKGTLFIIATDHTGRGYSSKFIDMPYSITSSFYKYEKSDLTENRSYRNCLRNVGVAPYKCNDCSIEAKRADTCKNYIEITNKC